MHCPIFCCIYTSATGSSLASSDLDWSYVGLPQTHTGDRVNTMYAGNVLGSGNTIDYRGWFRGDARDYDARARAVKDDRWSYGVLLPFFRKTEHYFDSSAGLGQHGFSGPIHIASGFLSDPGRRYPLRELIKAGWTELGIKYNS